MKRTTCAIFCEFYVFVTCVRLLYDKFSHDRSGVSLQTQFPAGLRSQRGYKEWNSMELGKTWKQCERWNASELENWMDKIKRYKIKLCKSCCTHNWERWLFVCTTYLPWDVLSPACWSCTTWSWFEGRRRNMLNLMGQNNEYSQGPWFNDKKNPKIYKV